MSTTTLPTDLRVTGNISAQSITSDTASITNGMCSPSMALSRSKLDQDTNEPFDVPLTDLRVHDAINTVLPGTPATDDLGLDSGVFGTEAAHVTAGDLKAAGATTRYARFQIQLPAEYDDGETVYVRVNAKMETTVADVSCTVDVEAYEIADDLTCGSDLITTAATSMNSLTAANFDFLLTSTGLLSGDRLDVRVAIACNDAATGTAVEPVISAIQLLADIKG